MITKREYRITNNGTIYRIEVFSGWWLWRRWRPVDQQTYLTLKIAEMYLDYCHAEDAYEAQLRGAWTTTPKQTPDPDIPPPPPLPDPARDPGRPVRTG